MNTSTAKSALSSVDAVRETAEAARKAAASASAIESVRDRAIASAVVDGVAVRDVVNASGLSRARVYQILDKASRQSQS